LGLWFWGIGDVGFSLFCTLVALLVGMLRICGA